MAKHKKERQTTNPIGLKINDVLREKNLIGDYAAVAEYFGVAVPSVYGWVDKGRISKDRLPMLTTWSGKPLTWWLGAEAEPDNASLMDALQDWRLQASTRSVAVIDQLTLLAKKNKLQEADWLLIEQLVQRFSQK